MKTLEVIEPTGQAPKRKVSNNKLDEAAALLNMVTVDARKIKAFNTVGAFLEQTGILNYGNGRYLGTAAVLARTVDLCDELVRNRELEVVIRKALIEVQLALCKALDDNTSKIIEVNSVQPARNPAKELPNKPFSIGQIVTPVQVNIQGTTVAKNTQGD